ncbi:hypothetical protein AT265_18620 [Bacillus cereus]|nr:hypothetical protein AT265_18620 [Bacillus cereus]
MSTKRSNTDFNTSPTKGATFNLIVEGLHRYISIPTPARGATQIVFSYFDKIVFQPPHLKEALLVITGYKELFLGFQSPPLQEVRRTTTDANDAGKIFQSTHQ